MFSTKNGLYERARKKFKITDGIKLFTYSFYKQRRQDVQVRHRGQYASVSRQMYHQGPDGHNHNYKCSVTRTEALD